MPWGGKSDSLRSRRPLPTDLSIFFPFHTSPLSDSLYAPATQARNLMSWLVEGPYDGQSKKSPVIFSTEQRRTSRKIKDFFLFASREKKLTYVSSVFALKTANVKCDKYSVSFRDQ